MNNSKPNKTQTKVYVALSGGVDSAVSAFILKEQGYEVTGVFMKNWSGDDFGIQDNCPWEKDQKDAQKVCEYLEIPFKTYNFEKSYRAQVINYFFESYKNGLTPNPDIMCNQKIKFGTFLSKAVGDGADMIATGHYAGKIKDENGKITLIRAKDPQKDQTYFLYRINQQQLQKTIFPLSELTKEEVRSIASHNEIPVADKKDSQGICFIGKIDVDEFLKTEIKPQKGDIIDIDTKKKVGEHEGSWYYTNGQRQGLGIGGSKKPYFVAGKDVEQNILFVAQGRDNPELYCHNLKLGSIHWINNEPTDENTLKGMVRYRQKPKPCRFNKKNNTVEFSEPVWKPSPGQSLVLLDGEKILGGGVIHEIM